MGHNVLVLKFFALNAEACKGEDHFLSKHIDPGPRKVYAEFDASVGKLILWDPSLFRAIHNGFSILCVYRIACVIHYNAAKEL